MARRSFEGNDMANDNWPRAVIVVGRQGMPATRKAQALAVFFGKTVVEHTDLPSDFYKAGKFSDTALVLTNDGDMAKYHVQTYGATAYDFEAAVALAGLDGSEPPEHEDVAGVIDGYGATRKGGRATPGWVSVWQGQRINTLFTLPADSTASDVNRAIRIYVQGYKRGEADSNAKALAAMRDALKALGLE